MADDQGGLFARTGKDSINIAGHKVPIALIGGVAALLGVVLVLRARSQGANVAQVGQTPSSSPYTAADSGFGLGYVSPDYSAALANLSAQLNTLEQGINTSGTASSTPAATAPASTPPQVVGSPLLFPISHNPNSHVVNIAAPVAGTVASIAG